MDYHSCLLQAFRRSGLAIIVLRSRVLVCECVYGAVSETSCACFLFLIRSAQFNCMGGTTGNTEIFLGQGDRGDDDTQDILYAESGDRFARVCYFVKFVIHMEIRMIIQLIYFCSINVRL